MAVQATISTPEPVPSGGASGGEPKPGKLWKLMALAFMVAVIGGECLVAVIYLSSGHGGETAAVDAETAHDPHSAPALDEAEHEGAEASEEAADHGGDEDAAGGDHGHGAKVGELEMDLGQYSLTVFQPASNSTLLVDFHLYGTVRVEDEGQFEERFEKHKHRIRDQVIVTVRSAEMADFADPGLGLLKRQILEKSNATLGVRLVRGVVFSEFTLIEQ